MGNIIQKLNRETEWVFETARELEKDVKMRNAVLCRGSNIWIVNFDRTLIMKYPITGQFKNDVSFYSADYDSANFLEEDGTLHFIKTYDDYERKKVSSAMFTLTDIDIDALWKELTVKKPYDVEFIMTEKLLSMFKDDLSHVEVQITPDKRIEYVQRDIFSGNIISIKKKDKPGLIADPNEKVTKVVEPFAIRLSDLAALLYKEGNVKFHLSQNSPGRCHIQASKFEAIVSWCVYDEMGTVTYIKEIHTPETKKSMRLKLRQNTNEERARSILSRRKGKEGGHLGIVASKPINQSLFERKKKPKILKPKRRKK